MSEKIALGIEEEPRTVSATEMAAALDRLREASEAYASARAERFDSFQYQAVSLGDRSHFELSIGKRVLRSERVSPSKDTVPVYSANVHTPFGHVAEPKVVDDVSRDSIIWGIDGNFDFNLIPAGTRFDITDHTGRAQIRSGVDIDARFLVYQLRNKIAEESFDRSFRASLANMRGFSVEVPVDADGSYDLSAQRTLAGYYERLDELRRDLLEAKAECDSLFGHFVAAGIGNDDGRLGE